ncbi:putative Se/S carrier-like protein [Oceanirhabdus sp. W0125-5]|uniref:putative Se/S carrier-like protein n=1 Tax=Oceanirhabdus sp. W0125-5 TaxID=2999116 RepID=UPI0022F2BCCF|nr:putative Se/S carrier-like protein [Oceanirhabdus sp. W0125-5]WBW96640.1 DUF3343 domain-containing protein [Oceanirhabdus sp. W0125-5]
MKNEVEYIAIFSSNNYTSFLFKKLKERKCRVSYISAPRSIVKSCKKAVKFYERDLYDVQQIIKTNNLKIKGIYKIVIKNRKVNYVLI